MGTLHQGIVLGDIIDDKRLHILERAGDRAAATFNNPEGIQIFRSLSVEPEIAQIMKRVRDGDYSSLGLFGKFAWWDYRMWSNQDTFNKWALLLLLRLDEKQSISALPREDLEICATHLANYSSRRAERLSMALEWGMGLSIPLAMLARWSGRRALYLPMNGWQRLLLGAWMYVELPAGFREFGYLRRIREKDVAARLMIDVFGDFDEEFKEMGIEYESSPPDPV
ncbi:hypothetical protein DICSQDRAFT_156708 [Dichomitus squalens LYAD-421 SS1]|uniref:Uncharacterized protein n=1 Tax=Dichomitus squalens (strain LYAD-421) TaxID=732165 RepID=R7SRD0_DICSQ|nr:uncharacterized protein DICSQDRAFT_156708 [Dichomitus squalens LYAD-421 SS1]EJF58513.1 hypothetical protein DICSQDRAFT_156708 [Dichomitus squalens LYAD-421 SS1]